MINFCSSLHLPVNRIASLYFGKAPCVELDVCRAPSGKMFDFGLDACKLTLAMMFEAYRPYCCVTVHSRSASALICVIFFNGICKFLAVSSDGDQDQDRLSNSRS